MGTTDSSALFLSAVKKSNVTRVEEDFSGVADAQQRHGWGGRIGGDMGNTCMQWRVRGWLVACGGESQVKVTEKEETTKWMARKKNDRSGKFFRRKKNRKMCIKGPWENRPTTPTKKALRAALSTMSNSGKVLHVQSLDTLRFI